MKVLLFLHLDHISWLYESILKAPNLRIRASLSSSSVMRLSGLALSSRLPHWNEKIKECVSNGKWEEAFSSYLGLINSGFQLADDLFPSITKACSNISFRHGEAMHACSVKQGYESFISVGNSTIDFYMKWGAVNSALSVFSGMGIKDSVSWNTIIHGHLDRGHLERGLWSFMQARVAGFEPNVSTLVLVIQVFRNLGYCLDGQKFHGYMIKSGFWAVTSVQNSLLNMYADVDMEDARNLFDEMPERDVISWSVIIGGYVQNEEAILSLQVYYEMVSKMGIQPDGLTMVGILKACSSIGDVEVGRPIHGSVVIRGLDHDVFIKNSLIDMYSKCMDAYSAFRVFNEMPLKNIVSWNSILSGLVRNEMHKKALETFDSMKREGVEADAVTLVNLLQVSKQSCELYQCKLIHGRMIRLCYEFNELLLSSLMDSYAKCNHVELACKLFSSMKRRNMASWGIMISGFTYCGMPDEAIAVYKEMVLTGERPNAVIIINLIEACAASAELGRSRWAHGIVVRRGLASDVAIGTAVLVMYSRCGAIEASRKTFDQVSEKNIMSWSAMIAAYGMNGQAHDALNLLSKMIEAGLKPNTVTALSVLSACSHGGLVVEGLSFFKDMVPTHGVQPGPEHYACVVDMLSRAGQLDNAVDLVELMPENLKASASLWGSLLSSCRRYVNSQIGVGVVSHVLELEPTSSAGYLLASGMHAADGSWIDAARMRGLVRERGVKVAAGYSLVYVGHKPYKFVATDNNSMAVECGIVVEELHRFMKIGGGGDDDDDDHIGVAVGY